MNTQDRNHPPVSSNDSLRRTEFKPPRRRWAGVIAACVVGAGIGALAVSSFYDDRSVGQKLDAAMDATQQKAAQTAEDLRAGASAALRDGAQAGDAAATALSDAGITAAVKTALAADPRLSALKIEVNTEAGVVSLEGPAPDQTSRERAEMLAAAPQGVLRVENRLVVPGATTQQ
jgi:osmotically-inducible protein OsmY